MRLSAYYSFRESLLTSLITVFNSSLKKQPTFHDAGTGFSREITSEKRAQKFRTDDVSLVFASVLSIGRSSEGNLLQPIRSTTQVWLVTRHQYGITENV